MYLQTIKNDQVIKVKIINCKKPKMTSGHFGRTWDIYCNFRYKETNRINVFADTTWGKKGYFNMENKWYCANIWDLDEISNTDVEMLRGV